MFLMLQYFTFHLPPGQNERVRIVHMQEEMPKPLLHADRLNPYCLWSQGQAMRVCVCVHSSGHAKLCVWIHTCMHNSLTLSLAEKKKSYDQ